MKKLILFLLTAVFLFGCGKKNQESTTSGKEERKEETTTQNKQSTINQDSINQVEENLSKEKMVKFALEEERIVNDTSGQFATDAEASSTYAGDNPDLKAPYTAWQTTGKPNVENYSDDGRSWVSKDADKGVEWLKLTFAKPVNAREVKIRQNMAPGAIIKIELIDTDGKSHSVWEGVDKTQYEKDKIVWFNTKFDKTTYKTKVVKKTMATNSVPGWNEIDAVQLIGE
jgi:ribosomal protein L31